MHRLLAAMNAHDIDAFVACFATDYRSEQPAHPSRAFRGSDQVRENWTSVFAGVPDFHAELLLSATTDEGVEIGEWRWWGTYTDGSPFAMDGSSCWGSRTRARLGPPLHGAGRSGRRRHRPDGARHLPPEHRRFGTRPPLHSPDTASVDRDERLHVRHSSRSHPPTALASIVVVLLWLWLSSLVVLIGSEVDGLRASRRY